LTIPLVIRKAWRASRRGCRDRPRERPWYGDGSQPGFATLCGMSLLNRISIDPEVVHGRPAVRGTRMRVTDVLSLLAAGADEAEILHDYPYLTSEDIKACLAYAAAQADHAIVIAS
jgi:uncharacterized protein (DUF433 family)